MPTVICKAKLKNYNKGTVKFRWEYWVSNEFKRRDKKKDGSYYNLCSRIGKSVFLGYSYSKNSEVTLWEVPFLKDSGNYYFKAIWNKIPPPTAPQHPAYGCDNFYTDYEGGNVVFTGGKIFVKLTAYDAAGKEIAWDTTSAGKLLGKNEQDQNRVYGYTGSNELIAILKHESKTKHFETDESRYPMYEEGWPVYGYPNGYGLMQIDNSPAAIEKQLWNWKSNIDGGKAKYFTVRDVAENFMKKHPNTYNEEMLLKCTFQKYNMNGYDPDTKMYHYFWKWDDKKQRWIDDEYIIERTKRMNMKARYGEAVFNIYKTLN